MTSILQKDVVGLDTTTVLAQYRSLWSTVCLSGQAVWVLFKKGRGHWLLKWLVGREESLQERGKGEWRQEDMLQPGSSCSCQAAAAPDCGF